MHLKTVLSLVISLLVLNGCAPVSETVIKGAQRDNEGVVAANKGKQYETMHTGDLLTLCRSLTRTRNFDEFFKCHTVLTQLVDKNEGYLKPYSFDDSEEYNKAWSEFELAGLLFEAYMDLGEHEKAIEIAEKRYELVKNNLFVSKNLENKSGLEKLADTLDVITSLGLGGTDEQMYKDLMTSNQINSFSDIAFAHVKSGNYEQAKPFIQELEALQIPDKMASEIQTQHKQTLLARVYYASEEYEKSRDAILNIPNRYTMADFLTQVVSPVLNPISHIAVQNTFGMSEEESQRLFNIEPTFILGRSYLKTGEIEASKNIYLQLIEDPKFSGLSVLYFASLYDLGKIAELEGDVEKAESYYKQAADVLESKRSSISTDSLKINFVADKNEVYGDLIGLLIKQNKIATAFDYAERGKARALVDLLASKKDFSQSNAEMKASLAQFNKVELDYINTPLAKREAKRGIVSAQYRKLQQAAPEAASLLSVSTPSVETLQNLLPEGEVLIEYYGTKNKLYAFVLTKQGLTSKQVDANGLADAVEAYRKALQAPKTNQYKALGSALYKRLVSPIDSDIAKNSNITIVPHSVLHYLPFNALNSGNQFFIDQHNVRVLPSASVMKFLNKSRQAEKALLVLGNPDLNNASLDLPGAQIEATNIAKNKAGSKLLLRADATETAVKQYGANYGLLHFASHGVFDAKNPLDSGLYLAKDSKNDGVLTVGELYDLKLNADLVTLSACETALGKVSNGDDVVGFTRGFLYAGADSVVASLWPVDDAATNQLMQSFYSNLKNKDKRSALRQAQLNVKETYKKHPYYWAAFQLAGAIN